MPSRKPKRKNKKIKEIGHIKSYFSGVAKVEGLPNVFLHEVLLDEKGKEAAIVIGFNESSVEVLFFDENYNTEKPVFRSFQSFSVSASEEVVGRVFNGLGKAIDSFGDIEGERIPAFRQAPGIIEREPVEIPLTTGIKIIDTVLPVGRGQRQLIIGDRKLGKSTIALDTVLNQKEAEKEVFCFYVICGQKEQKLQEIISLFKKYNAFNYSAIIAATADDSLASQYLAPFVGCALAEYFRDKGKDALIVYDDFSKHARIYRSITLLLERPPGRETYPGEIFFLHAGLLERAGRLAKARGGGSLTALPIIETQEGGISAFIPTNLISITDGQIYLERGLFQKGFLPAINVGLSVSRVGSQAQPEVLKEVVGGLRLALAQHKELQRLSQLETKVSQKAQKTIHRGELILELLKQKKHTFVSWPEQVILFYAMEEGFFDDLEKEKWGELEQMVLELIRIRYHYLIDRIRRGRFDAATKKEILKVVEDFKKEFIFS